MGQYAQENETGIFTQFAKSL